MKRPEAEGAFRYTLRISRKLADLCLSGLAELKGEPSPMKTTWYCPLDLAYKASASYLHWVDGSTRHSTGSKLDGHLFMVSSLTGRVIDLNVERCRIPDGGYEYMESTVSEMEDEGVIYTVVVKHGPVSQSGSQATVSRSQQVKAGTEEKLVLHLLHSFSMGDSSFTSIFLSTYRSFTSTQRVLDILTDRLENPPGDNQSNTRLMFNKAVCSVFSTWLRDYPEDFNSLSDPSCLLRLAPLLPGDSSGAEIKSRMLRVSEELSEKALLSGSLSDPTTATTYPPDPADFDATNILGFPSSVIAEQLTRIETELFLKLVPYHCLGSLWSQRDKKGREGACWSVRATIKQFNRLTNAVTASCLWNRALRSQQRARLLEKWISVAENFSSLYAILSALQSNPIHRLRKSWQETDREAVKRYEELSDIFSEKDNYSQSRELLKEVRIFDFH
ncbi:hypothetical protein DNTS_005496 [Danionella cerebrum]|uniref:Ras-GEF domain-containing protein n=1 Tax=Danionella cerebrum TaxID=2873325 RepID=A0A553PYI9_9TELE|nr:hypothetical protein DNTS_005496 [Danionella translucida]